MTSIPFAVSFVLIALGSPALAASPLGPAAAIEAADRAPATGVVGLYAITVAATAKVRHVVTLSSTPDPNGPGTLTFSLAHTVAAAFRKKYDAAPEVYLKGKRIVVSGAVRTVTVDDDVLGRSRSHVTHEVWVYELSQIVSIV